MIIGITDIMRGHDSLDNYLTWVGRSAPGTTLHILSPGGTPQEELDECDGILLTGGGDVHPAFYGRDDALRMAREVRTDRDDFEFGLIRRALAAGRPILGICRGCQVFNVALGGSLLPDLPGAGYLSHSRDGESTKVHPLLVMQGSLLRALLRTGAGMVNTSHHQAVLTPGKGLCIAALSDDNVVEAIEWAEPEGRSWILMVQWHPERAWGMEHSFSETIIGAFLGAAKQRKQ
jgi:putative glutamine amidotransferase